MRPNGNAYCQYVREQGRPSVLPSRPPDPAQSRPKDSEFIERDQYMVVPSARPHPLIINVLIMTLMTLAVASPAQAILASNYDSGVATSNGGFSPTTGLQDFYRVDEKPPLAYANYEDHRGVVGDRATIATRQEAGFVPSTMSAAGHHYAAANNLPPPMATIEEEQMIHGDGMGGEVSARPKIKFDYETKTNNYDAAAYGYEWRTQPAANRLPLLYKQYSDYLHHQGDQQHQRPGDLQGIPEQEDTRGIRQSANKSPLRKRPLRRRQHLQTTSSSEMNYQVADNNGQPLPGQQHYEEENSAAGYQNPPVDYPDPLMQLHELQQKMQEQLMRYDELQRQLLQQKHSMQQQQQTQQQTPQFQQYEQQQYDVQPRDNYAALQQPRANDLSTNSPHPGTGPTSSMTYSVDPSLPAITTTVHHTPASKAAAAGIPLSRHVQVTKHIPVRHYQQIHVPYNHTVPIRIPHTMITTVPRPYPIEVPVSKTVAVPKMQDITIPVEKVKPYAVARPIPYIVERRVPYRVEKHVTSPVYYPYPVKVPIVKTIVHQIDDSPTRLLRHSPNVRFLDHLMV